jgi:hypothetical protein
MFFTARKQMTRSLFAITEDFVELERRLDALDENAEAVELLQWMTELSAEQSAKIDAYCWVIKKLEAEQETARKIAQEFSEKKMARERKIDMLKRMLMGHMQATGNRKLLGEKFTIAIQKNGGSTPVVIPDETQIPKEFLAVKYMPMKDAIRERLERGEYVPGASLGERGESLRIK